MCGEVEKKNISFYETHRFVLFFRNVSFCGLYKNDESAINSLIGFRVLDYLKKEVISFKKVSDLSNDELYSQYPVKRDWTQQSLTFEYETKCNDADKIKAEEATQMTIIFNIK